MNVLTFVLWAFAATLGYAAPTPEDTAVDADDVVGYAPKFKWRNTISASDPPKRRRNNGRGTSVGEECGMSPMSASSVSSAPAIMDPQQTNSLRRWSYEVASSPALVPDLFSDLPAREKRLLHYWNENLSSLISVTPRRSSPGPFQLHLTSMLYHSGALRSTVLSMAANHLALTSSDRSFRIDAYRHQEDALHLLQNLIQAPTEQLSMEPALATVLMMQVSARLLGDESAEPQVANHLAGAKAMIAKRGGLAAWRTSSTAQFLLDLFAYHDILSSVSRGSRPLVDHSEGFTAIEGAVDMQGIAEVLRLVARISDMQGTAKTTVHNNSNDMPGFARLQTQGLLIKTALEALDFSEQKYGVEGATDSMDIRLTAEAYRHAAFIYLYRVWLGFGAPNPTTLHHVQQCIACIQRVNISSPLVSSHIWPLWTAGCEAIDQEQRQFVRERFRDMYRTRMFASLKRIVRDIEEVWSYKDTENLVSGLDGMAKVDCIQVILRRCGREVDLA
ncbi:hypothetical protein DM02DRAFT_654030 [Periconia macrospinosa]|uniref:Uncharacterized protein n=1 Tax=Periconia macrospinosa TaxID=97972 RepID=A0A2V1DXA3_9PLEO|nr:hypothetical protein DM02DRAFT_654030 [Periconia macrospinosa]